MDAREFVALVKHDAVDGALNGIATSLSAALVEPTIPPTEESVVTQAISDFVYRGKLQEYQRARWFQALGTDDQNRILALIRDTAELTGFGVLAILDGVGGDALGVFEIVEVDGRKRRVLNPENSEMLHDLFSEICESERLG